MADIDKGNITTPDAADLNAAARRYAAAQGWAMPDGSYPIRPLDMHGRQDAEKALHAVGRGGGSHDAIRRHIAARLRAIGLADMIPDTWRSSGSVQGRALAMGEKQFRVFEPELEIRSAAQGGDGRTIVGIAVPYNRPQRINANLTEEFAPGAFAHQFRSVHRIPFARGHIPLGGVAIGKTIEMRDDPAGLYGEWRVSKTPAGDETLELIKDGVYRELSVGFRERSDGNQTRPDGTVLRTKVDLFEVAVVPQGAYGAAATVTEVRCLDDEPMVEPVEQVPVQLRRDRAAQIIAGLPTLSLTAELEVRAAVSGLQYGRGTALWRYWTGPRGFARYAHSPNPWTTLRDALIKEGVPAAQAPGLATEIMQATPAGRALFKAHHSGAHH